MFGLGLGELLVLLAIVTFIFGRRRLPELGKQITQSIRGFKQGMKGEEEARKLRDVEELKPK